MTRRERRLRDPKVRRAMVSALIGEFQMFVEAIIRGDFLMATFHHLRALGWRESRAWRTARRRMRACAVTYDVPLPGRLAVSRAVEAAGGSE